MSKKQEPFAEVKLTFEVVADELPSPFNTPGQVVVGRRLHRSGESEYIINKSKARLKDIQSLFLGTGAGLSSYSIIEQGAVGFIVMARPSERRSLIEEAAGISRYKSQRRVSERNLEVTGQNLERVDDLYREVTRQVKSLKQQAGRAERYEALQLEERQLGLCAWLWERRALAARLVTAKRQAGAAEDERKKIEDGQRAEREHFAIARFEKEKLRKRQEEVVERCLRVEAREQLLKGNIDYAGKEIAQLRTSLEDDNQRLEMLAARSEESIASRARIEEQVTELEDIRPQQQRVASLKQSLSEDRQRLQSMSQHLSQIRHQKRGVETQLERVEERLRGLCEASGRLEERRLRVAEENHHIATDLAESSRDLEDATRVFDEAKEVAERAEERSQTLREENTRCVRGAEAARTQDRRANDRVIRLSATLRALEDVAQRDDLPRKNQLAKIAARARRIPLAAMIDLPREHGLKLAAALEGDLDALWVDPNADAEALDALFDSASGIEQRLVALGAPVRGSVVGLPLNITPLPPPGISDPAARAEAQARLGAWLQQRLGRVDFCEGDLVPRWRAGERPEAGRLWVDARGRFLDSSGALRRAGLSAAEDLLERARRTRATREELVEARAHAEVAAEALQRANDEATAVRDLLEDANERLEEARAFLADARGMHREVSVRYEARLERQRHCERDLDAIEEESIRQDREQQTLEENQLMLQQERRTLHESQGELEQHHGQQQQSAQDIERDVHQAQMNLTRLEAQRQARLESLSQARRLESSITEQIRRLKMEVTSLTHKAEERREQLVHDRAELERAGGEAKSAKEERAKLDEVIQRCGTRLAEHEGNLQRADAQLRALASQREAASVEASRCEATVETLDRQNAERYDVSITDGRDEVKDILTHDFDEKQRRHLEKIRKQLRRFGEVNTGAIRAYTEAMEREKEIVEQRDDLLKAVADLKKAIGRIDQTCRKRFKETFDTVNQSFQEIFPRLFSGGRAQLVLTEPNDLLASGVDIVAQPPGKRLQVLSLLSGGEKAMTAVALMTALFLLRPAPFCILDEVDAPLDDINVTRFTRLLEELTEKSQLLVVTHNRLTMRSASRLYGVTMQRDGISQLLSIRLGEFPDQVAPPKQKPRMPLLAKLTEAVGL